MSSTMTTTLTHTPQNILSDYTLRHTGHHEDPITTNDAVRPRAPQHSPWDTTHRRVPAFRPINSQRDQTEVRVYRNGIERAFITVMFAGVFLNAVSLLLRGEADILF
jgi:hypothetical protein